MNAMPLVYILWDDSQIWGLLAARGAKAMGLPHRLVRGREIAGGLLSRRPPALLLVPGGNARHKAQSLGAKGLQAVRAYVEEGGRYLGFCGGAGLALTWEGLPPGLGLCPWRRAGFEDRLQHFMSGHLHVSLPAQHKKRAELVPPDLPELPCLPVWWPGRFLAEEHEDITVLAVYERPAKDFWLADIPVDDLPPDAFAAWQDVYGLPFNPAFLAGQPCLLYGNFGKGAYILSYSHLETPDSPHANRWLAHLLHRFAGICPKRERIPPWQTRGKNPLWDDPLLRRMEDDLRHVLQTGLKHDLLFSRTQWLMGWRTGIPGAGLNNLRAALGMVRAKKPRAGSLQFWEEHKEALAEAMEMFRKGCIQYLLAERLALTLAKSLPETVSTAMLKDQRESLFGPPMQAGGLYRSLMEPLDELAFLQLAGEGKE